MPRKVQHRGVRFARPKSDIVVFIKILNQNLNLQGTKIESSCNIILILKFQDAEISSFK